MDSNDRIDPAAAAVELSAAAHRVATMAAHDADVPLPRWIALAILSAAADQAGFGQAAPGPNSPPPSATDEPETLQATLRRLEAKLDNVLAMRPTAGARHPLD